MLKIMARPIVRQAGTIAELRQSTAWVFWLQTAPPSLVPIFASTAADETSEVYGQGLRVALIWALFRVVRDTPQTSSPKP